MGYGCGSLCGSLLRWRVWCPTAMSYGGGSLCGHRFCLLMPPLQGAASRAQIKKGKKIRPKATEHVSTMVVGLWVAFLSLFWLSRFSCLSWLSCLSWRSVLVPLQGVAAQSVPLIPTISCVLGCLGCLACLGCLCSLYVWVSLSLSLAWLTVSVLRFVLSLFSLSLSLSLSLSSVCSLVCLWCLCGARAKAIVKWVSFSLVLRAVEGGRRFSCFSVGNRSDP
jgi:hypothetical protein